MKAKYFQNGLGWVGLGWVGLGLGWVGLGSELAKSQSRQVFDVSVRFDRDI